jgi:hypothetical protein
MGLVDPGSLESELLVRKMLGKGGGVFTIVQHATTLVIMQNLVRQQSKIPTA